MKFQNKKTVYAGQSNCLTLRALISRNVEVPTFFASSSVSCQGIQQVETAQKCL